MKTACLTDWLVFCMSLEIRVKRLTGNDRPWHLPIQLYRMVQMNLRSFLSSASQFTKNQNRILSFTSWFRKITNFIATWLHFAVPDFKVNASFIVWIVSIKYPLYLVHKIHLNSRPLESSFIWNIEIKKNPRYHI